MDWSSSTTRITSKSSTSSLPHYPVTSRGRRHFVPCDIVKMRIFGGLRAEYPHLAWGLRAQSERSAQRRGGGMSRSVTFIFDAVGPDQPPSGDEEAGIEPAISRRTGVEN